MDIDLTYFNGLNLLYFALCCIVPANKDDNICYVGA